jgi:hypothetical protein
MRERYRKKNTRHESVAGGGAVRTQNGRMRVHDRQTETGRLLNSVRGGRRCGRMQENSGWKAGKKNGRASTSSSNGVTSCFNSLCADRFVIG